MTTLAPVPSFHEAPASNEVTLKQNDSFEITNASIVSIPGSSTRLIIDQFKAPNGREAAWVINKTEDPQQPWQMLTRTPDDRLNQNKIYGMRRETGGFEPHALGISHPENPVF